MSEIQIWFEEAKKEALVFNVLEDEFVIYKGFKLTNGDSGYVLEDTRFSNMYTPVTKTSMEKFRTHGFVKGADIISFERNTKRVESFKRRAELLYDKRRKFKKELPKNKRLNEKRIRNINKRIEEFIDHMFLFKSRIQQFNNKYNLDENTGTTSESLQESQQSS